MLYVDLRPKCLARYVRWSFGCGTNGSLANYDRSCHSDGRSSPDGSTRKPTLFGQVFLIAEGADRSSASSARRRSAIANKP